MVKLPAIYAHWHTKTLLGSLNPLYLRWDDEECMSACCRIINRLCKHGGMSYLEKGVVVA